MLGANRFGESSRKPIAFLFIARLLRFRLYKCKSEQMSLYARRWKISYQGLWKKEKVLMGMLKPLVLIVWERTATVVGSLVEVSVEDRR